MTSPDTAYLALQNAAERIGAWQYKIQSANHGRRRSMKTFRFTVTPEHAELIAAMLAVKNDRMTVEEAMALLHYGATGYALEQARKDVPLPAVRTPS
jgi:hypothetical protein